MKPHFQSNLSSTFLQKIKLGLSFGLAGLVANLAFLEINSFSSPVGIFFPALLAITNLPLATIVSSAIALLPLTYWPYLLLSSAKIFLALSLFAGLTKVRRAIGILLGYIIISASLEFLVALSTNYQIAWNNLLIEVIMIALADLILTNKSIAKQFSTKPKVLSQPEVILPISNVIFLVGFATASASIYFFNTQYVSIVNTQTLCLFILIGLTLYSFLMTLFTNYLKTTQAGFLPTVFRAPAINGLAATVTSKDTDLQNSYLEALNAAPQNSAMLIVGAHNQVVFINQLFANLFGVAAEKTNQKLIEEIEHGKRLLELCQLARLNTKAQSELRTSNNGQVRYVSISATTNPGLLPEALKHVHGIVILTAKDVTHRRSLSSSELQSQRLTAITKNFVCLVHDLNNQLMAICGLISSANMSDTPALRKQQLDLAIVTAHQAANLLKQSGSFIRPSETDFKLVNLQDFINEQSNLIKQTLGPLSELQINFSAQPAIQANSNQLIQAFINIADNFAKLSDGPASRKITMNIDSEFIDQAACELIPGAHAGKYARLQIKGFTKILSPNMINNAFAVLQQSKSEGSIAIDLSSAYSIIRAHDGFMLLENQAKIGTTVTIYLPEENVKSVPSTAAEDCIISHCINHGHGESILVVEDNQDVCQVIEKMLDQLGYHVKTCDNGKTALTLCEQQEFALILTDLMLPQMSGFELIEKLQPNSKTKVLLMTGYGANEQINKTNYNVLPKPFDIATLAEKVRAALVASH